jgi:hypothetical protein
MSDRSKSHSTEPDRTPTAVAVAAQQGDPATDLIVVLTGAVQNSPTGPRPSMTCRKPVTRSSRYP